MANRNPTPQRKGIRLPRTEYLGRQAYFVTICCRQRKRFFADSLRANELVSTLRALGSDFRFAIHAFCVMPDHIHFLADGLADDCDLLAFVNCFKQQTAYSEKRKSHLPLWQRYFYDHIVRPGESMDAVAWYIWMNPVRKGLCSDPAVYRFSGSFTMKWKSPHPPTTDWLPPWKQKLRAG